MNSVIATARHEEPAYLRAGDHDIFAILTRPTGEANGFGIVILAGGIYTLSINRNRLSVELARRLAPRRRSTASFGSVGRGRPMSAAS